MLRSEYQEARDEVASLRPTIALASQKCDTGDVRGARVRLERAVEVLRRVEESCCNPSGYLNDPGDDVLNGNVPGPPR